MIIIWDDFEVRYILWKKRMDVERDKQRVIWVRQVEGIVGYQNQNGIVKTAVLYNFRVSIVPAMASTVEVPHCICESSGCLFGGRRHLLRPHSVPVKSEPRISGYCKYGEGGGILHCLSDRIG